ncbi:MAG: carboxypeptidase regulatory-like domain-containing protein [Pyrinomonadaceae bacterium]
MRQNLRRASLTLCAFALVLAAAQSRPTYGAGSARRLGTISGTVRDQKGQPLAGALVQLLRDGAQDIVKQTRSNTDGSFTTRIAPGRYVLSAIAVGFNAVTFTAVQVKPSDELIYRFNLVPLGQGRTVPERRADRNDPKWRLRSAQAQRSIFQAHEGEDATIAAVEAAEEADAVEAQAERDAEGNVLLSSADGKRRPVHGIVETFVAASANPLAPNYTGLNFAVTAPASDTVELIFAGQVGTNALARFETTGRVRAGNKHRVSATLGAASLPLLVKQAQGRSTLDQLSVRTIDEWVVRDGVVVVLGLDYSRFLGAKTGGAFSPRIGFEFAANANTHLKFGYAPGDRSTGAQSVAKFEDGAVVFPEVSEQAVAFVDGRAVSERSQRLEFGIERVLDNKSSVEATAFFDTTDGRGVGLLNMPLNAFSDRTGATLLKVADQQGAARGFRLVYTRRLSKFLQARAGYSIGRGQALAPVAADNNAAPDQIFHDGFFQTAAAQLDSDIGTGMRVRTILRFSPRAAVFAIDPFAGQLAVFDPSLSILVTQDLPTFGLPLRAEAVLDARNLLDAQCGVDDGDTLVLVGNTRRSVRGGISVRF